MSALKITDETEMPGITLPPPSPPHLYGLHRCRGENIKITERKGSATLGQTHSELFSQAGELKEKCLRKERHPKSLML